MIQSKIEILIVKYITKSTTLNDLDTLNKLINEKNTLKLKAITLCELQLLSEMIFAKDDLEMVGKVKLCWSWRHFKRVWTVKVRRINAT